MVQVDQFLDKSTRFLVASPCLHRRLPAPPEAQNGGQTQQLPQEAAQDARPKAKGVDERQGAHRDDGTHLGSWANLGDLMGMYLER